MMVLKLSLQFINEVICGISGSNTGPTLPTNVHIYCTYLQEYSIIGIFSELRLKIIIINDYIMHQAGLRYTVLFVIFNCITSHCIALHCIALHCNIALHCITLYYIVLYCIAVHCMIMCKLIF